MKYKLSTTRSIYWWRVSAACATAALALGWAAAARATDLTANKTCRSGIGTQLSGVIKKGMQSQEKCYALAAKVGVGSAICTDPQSFPFTIIDSAAYQKAQDKAEVNLITKTPGKPMCPGATTPETLDNYVDNDTGSTYDNLSKLLALSADYVIGSADLNGDTKVATCQKTIAVARRNIATTMLAEALKCQKAKDKLATGGVDFAGLSHVSPDCLAETTPVTNKITSQSTLITKKCTSPTLTAAQIAALGACTPLPGCVADSARATGRNLALAAYPSQTCEPNPSLVPNGRAVTVALNVPSGITLSGADVRVNYPPFQSGVPGNGNETDPIDVNSLPPSTFENATDKDGTLDVNLVFGNGFSDSGVAFRVLMDKCEDFSQGLCSVTTAATCSAQKDCAPHCLERASGGTANNTNTACQVDTDCPASGATAGFIQKCVCPTCSQKHCVGPNLNPSSNAICNWNTECDGRCAGKEFGETGATCQTDFQCGGAAGSCRHVFGCSDYLRSVCTLDADCNGGTAPVCTSGKCSAGPLAGVAACTTNADCAIGHCSVANSANAGRNCAVANVKTDCGGHCSTTSSMVCNTNSQCPQSPIAETCVFGTCDTSSPASGACNVGNPASGPTGGGSFCTPVEVCNAQDEVCSVSQYLGCGAPADPACPAGEQCVTQSQLTTCTVLSALDQGANEVDGVTCTIGVQGHCSLNAAVLCNTDNQCLPSSGTCVQP